MSKLIGFSNIGLFIGFLERITTVHDWRDLRCMWPLKSSYPYAIELPDEVESKEEEGIKVVPDKNFADGTDVRHLGDVWRYARPTGRRHTPGSAPACWLIVVKQNSAEVFEHVIEHAPGGVQWIEFSEHGDGSHTRLRGFIVHGACGEAVALSPPPGCIGYGCDNLPNGGRAALPHGWTIPRIPEFLWPEQNNGLVLYESVDDAEHSARLFEQAATPLNLADLIETLPFSGNIQSAVASFGKPAQVPWKVAKRSEFHDGDVEEVAPHAERPAVFRIRTRKDVFGQTMLQVLDEAESRRIPEFSYAAADWQDAEGPERWHFIYSDRVDGRLMSSWNTLERFDVVSELQEDGLEVFVARGSRVSPPFGIVVAAAEDRSSIIQRIRQLLGNPPEGTMVLLEASEENSLKPIVTHIPHAQSKPLTEIIRAVVHDWNIAPPLAAVVACARRPEVDSWRNAARQTLTAIARDEQAELSRGVDASANMLETEANRALQALEAASVPVREAIELSGQLQDTLNTGAASLEASCAALAKLADQLTNPRRAWLRDQTTATALSLREASPRLDELTAVRELSSNLQVQLNGETERLSSATQILHDLAAPLDAASKSASDSALAAQAQVLEIERRAAEVARNIASHREEIRQQLEAARIRNDEVNRQKAQLATERAAVEQLERANSVMAADNERTRLEMERRRKDAGTELVRLKEIRDVAIPRLKTDAALAEQKVKDLDPVRIEQGLNEAQDELNKQKGHLRDLEQTQYATEQVERESSQLAAEVGTKKAELTCRRNSAEAEITRLRLEREVTIQRVLQENEEAQKKIDQLAPEKTKEEWTRLNEQLNLILSRIKETENQQQEIESCKAKQQVLEQNLERASSELLSRKKALEEQSIRLQSAKVTSLPQLQGELVDYETKLANLDPIGTETRLADCRGKLDALNAQIIACDAQRIQLQDAVKRLDASRKSLQEQKQNNDILESTVRDLGKQLDELHAAVAGSPSTPKQQELAGQRRKILAAAKNQLDELERTGSAKPASFWQRLTKSFR